MMTTWRVTVELHRIIAEIDSQIAKLQQARSLLTESSAAVRTGPGRPRGSKNTAAKAVATKAVAAPKKRKRRLSAEGRKRIADAMKKRWAERRKQAAKA